MPRTVTRDEVQQLLAEGAQLLDALPEGEFAEEHLPGAVNVPFARLDRQSVAHFDPQRPIIVYCWDTD